MTTGAAFGTIMRKHRHLKRLSQEQVADESGLDRTFISMLERGVRQPSLETILRIGRCLSVPASQLVQEVEQLLHENE